MGIIAWFSLFNFSWLRRCKTCGVRGSKCLCRRPSLALEHIFFLEERKNKFGARNFSHVSDTMMTSNSTMFTNSSTAFNSSSTNNGGAGPASNLSNSTVLMRGDSDVNPTDYYYQSAAGVPPSDTSDNSAELLTPRMAKQLESRKQRSSRHQRHSRRQRSLSNRAETKVHAESAPTALVRKGSGRMRSKAKHSGDTNRRPPIKEVITGEYILYTEENIPVSLPHRQQQIVPRSRRRSREQNNSALNAKMLETAQFKEEPGVSFQFYGRSGSGRGGAPVPAPSNAMVTSNRSLGSSVSTNDSFMMGSNSISSMRTSQYSDRVSLETNFGSLNPQNGLGNTGGRFIESGYAPSIKEDDEALEQLTGWFHASSVSTQDSFLMSR